MCYTQLYHVTPLQRNTVLLHENTQVTQTSMWPHKIIAPCGQTQYLTHGDISIQFPFHTHEHSQVYAQKDSGPDIAFRAVFTPKTRFLIELCTQSGDKPLCYITQIQTLVVQPAHGHTHTHTSHTATDKLSQTMTQAQVHIVIEGHRHAGHTQTEATVTYNPPTQTRKVDVSIA